ncbi:hypothetical protein DFP72DRAFT_1169474 [Ephemerocybe angulata]|uniref:C2H2-type domain-containing protein n=1 Tax=Ephemerocybe angulata TaxID=980116 RepID=A0A8H6HYL6_9AGAR|nr:hypothetical protein DFP72DRAFT_1169474 [Tulosesus angulatus]
MRMSTLPAILSVAIYLSSYANAYRYDEQNEVYTREPHYVDTLSHEITARDLLSELTTRELVDELKRRSRSRCPRCGEEFQLQENLDKHIENKHKARPKFVCPDHPNMEFPSANELRRHNRETHDRGICSTCQLDIPANLRRHRGTCQTRAPPPSPA